MEACVHCQTRTFCLRTCRELSDSSTPLRFPDLSQPLRPACVPESSADGVSSEPATRRGRRRELNPARCYGFETGYNCFFQAAQESVDFSPNTVWIKEQARLRLAWLVNLAYVIFWGNCLYIHGLWTKRTGALLRCSYRRGRGLAGERSKSGVFLKTEVKSFNTETSLWKRCVA